MTPSELRRDIILDFKRQGINYAEAAERLGYASKQTVSNILNDKRELFFSYTTAQRFNKAFNYDMKTLLEGKGRPILGDITTVFLSDISQKEDSPLSLEMQLSILEYFFTAVAEAHDAHDRIYLRDLYFDNIKGKTASAAISGLLLGADFIGRLGVPKKNSKK